MPLSSRPRHTSPQPSGCHAAWSVTTTAATATRAGSSTADAGVSAGGSSGSSSGSGGSHLEVEAAALNPDDISWPRATRPRLQQRDQTCNLGYYVHRANVALLQTCRPEAFVLLRVHSLARAYARKYLVAQEHFNSVRLATSFLYPAALSAQCQHAVYLHARVPRPAGPGGSNRPQLKRRLGQPHSCCSTDSSAGAPRPPTGCASRYLPRHL